MEMKSMGRKIVFISVYFGETDYMKLESVILNCSKLIKKIGNSKSNLRAIDIQVNFICTYQYETLY